MQYQIHNDSLMVTISEHGAEIISVIDDKCKERIWQGKEGVWTEHAPILFPICGGLKDDCYYLDGKAYLLPKHGFAKNMEWSLTEKTDSSLTFVLDKKTDGFPFDYKLYARYELNASSIDVEYTTENEGERTFWYCIGSHEGYTLDCAIDECVLELEKCEDIYLSLQEGNLLKTEEYLFSENSRTIPLKREFFANGAMIMRSIKSRSIVLSGKNGRIVRVEYPEMGVIIVWAKPSERFICIEPWTCAPDLQTATGIFEDKPGSIELKPGERKTLKHNISFF